VSRDIIFYETVFLFSTLHLNVGAHLRNEILLLPPTLHSLHGGANVELINVNNVADSFVESHAGLQLHLVWKNFIPWIGRPQ
jgi:hypothetical protein